MGLVHRLMIALTLCICCPVGMTKCQDLAARSRNCTESDRAGVSAACQACRLTSAPQDTEGSSA